MGGDYKPQTCSGVTGKGYSMRLPEKAAVIVAKYANTENRYVFPILNETNETPAQQDFKIRKVARKINEALRAIAGRLQYQIPNLSFYTARHTYANALKSAWVSVAVISEALGHSDIRTTDNYLRSFGDDVLEEADKLLG